MNDTLKAAVLSAVRTVLIIAGTYAVSKGWFTSGVVEQVIGAVITVAAGAWGVADKFK
jgi:hypothetical protein